MVVEISTVQKQNTLTTVNGIFPTSFLPSDVGLRRPWGSWPCVAAFSCFAGLGFRWRQPAGRPAPWSAFRPPSSPSPGRCPAAARPTAPTAATLGIDFAPAFASPFRTEKKYHYNGAVSKDELEIGVDCKPSELQWQRLWPEARPRGGSGVLTGPYCSNPF